MDLMRNDIKNKNDGNSWGTCHGLVELGTIK